MVRGGMLVVEEVGDKFSEAEESEDDNDRGTEDAEEQIEDPANQSKEDECEHGCRFVFD